MKKVISFIILIMMIAVFAGCSGGGAGTSSSPGASPSATLPLFTPGSLGASATPAPSASLSPTPEPISAPDQAFTQFINMGAAAFEGMAVKISSGEEQDKKDALIIANTMYKGMLTMAPVEAIAGSDKINALEDAGYSDISVKQSGNSYTIKYTNPNKTAVKQTCVYDSSTGSMQTALFDSNDNQQLVLEFVLTPGGYAAQCYAKGNDGKYQTCTAFFNGSDFISFGLVKSSDSAPASIFSNTSITTDFVKNGDTYCQINGTTLFIYDNGALKTYTD